MTKSSVNKVIMAVGSISGIASIGWLIDHAALVTLLPPDIANMTFNTALCFVLLAVVCLRLNRDHSTFCLPCKLLTLFVALIAALSLLQDIFSIRLGIDNLLFDSHAYGLTSPYPGRMSPATAVGFLLSSIALYSLLASKQERSFSFFSHVLILVVGMLALLGISMNILESVAAGSYEHFASISILTGISFLLLAIAMLAIYERKIQGENAILYSGIHLMYRLKYPQKFALISVIFIVPLAVLMWGKIHEGEQEVAKVQLKMSAIGSIYLAEQLFKNLAEHRGMTNVSFSNPAVFRQALLQKTTQIDQLLMESARMDQMQAKSIPNDWAGEVTSRWDALKEKPLDQLQQWQAHTEIIDFLIRHIRDVGEESSLIFEEDPSLQNLLIMQFEVMPGLFESIGKLRGQVAGIPSNKVISTGSHLLLGTMVDQVGQVDLELETLERVTRQPMALQNLEGLRFLLATFRSQVHAFLSATEWRFHAENQSVLTSAKYFQMATKTIELGYALNSASMAYITGQLQKQIIASSTSQYDIKSAAVLLLLVLLFLFFSFYKSVINTIRALDETAENMRGGDIGGRVELLAKDELGSVVNSFNTIAEELTRVSTHMSAVVDHVLEGIITIDKSGMIKSFNPAAERIFGYTQDEVREQNIVMLMPEKYRARHREGLQHYYQTQQGLIIGTTSSIAVRGLKKDGSEFPMELSVNIMEVDGKLVFIGMVRDVSEHHSLEKQFRQAQKMQALGVLVSGVAHNFNNLLGAIVGKAYLGKKKLQHDAQIVPYFDSISDIAQQAGEMVRQLLAFSHKDFSEDKKNTQLDVIIKEAFATTKLGIEESISLSLQIANTDMVVYCDGNQIQQVVMNMVNNARDAVAECAEKRIAVSLEKCKPTSSFFHRQPELVPGEYALLSISDTGHGMDAETMENIFDPFFTSKAMGQGTGLGLSSAFGSIASHGGVIEVDSVLGSGTVFQVYLPLIDTNKVNESDNTSPEIVKSSGHELLLLVDDEPLIVQAMQEVLEDLGYKVVTASNGIEGLECFKQSENKIAAVITDVVMPEMGGVDMSRGIRQIDMTVPIIFITGYDHGDVKLQDDEKKNTMVISKPVQIPELSQAIRKMLTAIE